MKYTKEQRRASRETYYSKHKKDILDYQKRYRESPEGKILIKKRRLLDNKKRRERQREFLFNYKKEHPCYKCGESDPVCLHFHHRNPDEKTKGISRMGQSITGWEKLKAEIAKCDVLCANCHLKLHAKDNT